MKTILILLGALAFSASAQNPEAPKQPWKPTGTGLDKTGSTALAPVAGATTITGTVKQRTAEGLLIQTRMKGDGGLVWLTGHDAKEGTRISLAAVKDGAFDYSAVSGAAKTIDAYKAVK